MTVRVAPQSAVQPLPSAPAVTRNEAVEPRPEAIAPRADVFARHPEAAPGSSAGSAPAVARGWFHLGNATEVPNQFEIQLSGHHPPAAGGNVLEKAKQAALNVDLEGLAQESLVTGSHLPLDGTIRALLSRLQVTRPLADGPVSEADYSSRVPGRSAREVFEFMVDHPKAVFGAANLSLRPGTARLVDGARVMLQDSSRPPALWFPVEIHLDAANQRIHIETLDGHPFRGSNDFHFEDDGQGGCRIDQRSQFQGSSDLIVAGVAAGAMEKQHAAWKGLHAFLFEALARS